MVYKLFYIVTPALGIAFGLIKFLKVKIPQPVLNGKVINSDNILNRYSSKATIDNAS